MRPLRHPCALRRARRAGIALAVAVTALTIGAGPTAAPAGAAPPPLPAPDSHGLTLNGWWEVHPWVPASQPRLIDAEVTTDAIFEPVGSGPDTTVAIRFRVYLPANYDPERATPYPVLYLLNGGGGDFQGWSLVTELFGGDLKATLANVMDPNPTDATPGTPFPGIVVMPEGGLAGWYADWFGGTLGNFAPHWETFHIDELVPWVDANLNTSGTRSGRAIGGLSMGGTGALRYAARHSDVFSAVGSFSPGTDLTRPWAQQIVGDSLVSAGATIGVGGIVQPSFRVDPAKSHLQRVETVFGPAVGGDWPTQNPMAMIDDYQAFDGRFGLYSGQSTGAYADDGEGELGVAVEDFHDELDDAGVDHRYCAGPGNHGWAFWKRDLADFVNYVYGSAWTTRCTLNAGWDEDYEVTPRTP